MICNEFEIDRGCSGMVENKTSLNHACCHPSSLTVLASAYFDLRDSVCANHALSSRIKSIEGVQVNQNSISPMLPFSLLFA